MIIIEENKLVEFLKTIYFRYGHDFIHYNHSTLKRRIEVHCIKLSIENFDEYCKFILSHKNNFDDMFNHFSINVTEFFREPEQLKLFRERVIPYLDSFAHIKVWCAGCSSGESPYSMAIMLHEAGVLDKSQIYATDFNNRVLAHAKDGLFEIKEFKQSYLNYEKSGGTKAFKEYFIKKGKYYKIKNFLKEKTLFFNHNLATDGVMNQFQLIVCKNVIIYFDDELKRRVINLFDSSLDCSGFLILGKSEYLPSEFVEQTLNNHFKNKFELYIPKSKVYHKKCK